MARYRGTYDGDRDEPYELSRGKLESFIKCHACFWLERAKGVSFPSMPGFLLNTNTDTLLKKDFDSYRGIGPHLAMSHFGQKSLRPFAHPDMDKWTKSLHFNVAIIPYEGNDEWVEGALRAVAETLDSKIWPAHSKECGYERLTSETIAETDVTAH